ncbi:hypothetical protein LJ725_13395 [Reyranella aquatilis]|uniref:DUF4145 domain-containing protein n=1 Tax=Reyranella aquatilis TaxID=2035356 RepID=A0ABS8KV75_9HYPH|nr:hypothetical protein [Reyranella aquatilis]MCC8429969.1 hypothetical protein [Reyranella aquatilis]
MVALPRFVSTARAFSGAQIGPNGLGSMDKTKAGGTPIALRVLKELVLPLAGGVAYGAVVAQAKQMPLDGVTAGGVAFFCILAAQGLVLGAARAARNEKAAPPALPAPPSEPARLPAPEKEPAQEPTREPVGEAAKEAAKAPKSPPLIVIEPTFEPVAAPVSMTVVELALTPAPAPKPANDFVSIRVGVEELKEQGVWPEPVEEKPDDGQRPLFRNLAHSPATRTPVEALAPKQLLDLKMPYQAVLNAAVNFEREIKRRAGLPDDRIVALESLFEQERFNLSSEQQKQLDTLRRIRNNILHGFETLVDPVEAAALVAAFDRAASWFDLANITREKSEKEEPETPVKVKGPTNDEAEEPAKEKLTD